ncbi:hypothetical protein [Sphingobium tyrosinilyticum]|uniref:hypothetical protein n=1 Tax=Sphingobium tyrosinilyticum TaxID=2715436 RepID=UPI0036D38059
MSARKLKGRFMIAEPARDCPKVKRPGLRGDKCNQREPKHRYDVFKDVAGLESCADVADIASTCGCIHKPGVPREAARLRN